MDLMTTKNNLTVVGTRKYYQSSSRWRHSRWSTLLVAFIIALITTCIITTINRRAEKSNQAQILLIYIKGQLIQLSALEWQAIAERKLSSELLTEVQYVRSQTQEMSNQLKVIEPQNSKLQRFFYLRNEYDIAVDQEFKLLAAGQIAQAVIVDEEDVDPTYDKLNTEITNLNAHYIAILNRL